LAIAAWGLRRAVHGVDALGVAWCIGTFIPFELLSAAFGRTSYLYYMVIVMPGVYVVVARLIERRVLPRRLVGTWMFVVIAAAVLMYPFTPLP
jgi:hypothetical protein